jgi:hypothetical protein
MDTLNFPEMPKKDESEVNLYEFHTENLTLWQLK